MLRAVATVVLVLSGVPAATPAQAAPATSDQVYTALGVNTVPADYVVLVDVSGSMRGPRYAQLKRGLSEFLTALAPDDQVTVVPFAEKPRPARTQAAGRTAARLTSRLPPEADGGSTDIGAALEKSLDVLSRPKAPAVASVVLLTDGRHEPPAGSPYPFTGGYQWTALAKRARALKKTSLGAFAVPLSANTGAPLLGKVFPGARTLRPTGLDGLTTALDQPKQAARAAKARTLLAGETLKGITVTWPEGTVGRGSSTLPVRLTSELTRVPLTIDGLAVATGNPGARASVPGTPIELPPGGSVTVPVTVEWPAGPRRVAPFATVRETAPLTLTGRIGSPWHDVITGELGLEFAPVLKAAGRDVELSAQRGSAVQWGLGLVALAALVAVAWWARGRRLRPELFGTLSVRNGDKPERTLALSGRQLRLTAGAAGVPGAGTVSATRGSLGSAPVELRITYSPDGSEARRESRHCTPDVTVNIGGVRFTWRAAARPSNLR
uniref:VWA domain-containing protein n=1 Tax=Paractinoplanes polyasparticus TaxID=2856853 RepID=UPI001C843FC0|nr:vWA domain-containing protein [Actinoplanes polyasparticus]